ncbi:alcohol dehydrogenase [Apiospora rasikravindrae]|uniref:Alcohol dehydrogenase n=1 Tax=Apiospora rasikravindrae TaxID=990691 RepID=A0ABR1TA74_9PEZI
MQNNQVAFILAADNSPLRVGPGPDQSRPAADEVVIQVAAVAINPSEWKVGGEVRRFKAGDRVIGHCSGLLYGGAKHGGFQNFTTLREAVTAPIPDAARFEDAVVLPLAISTASVGLFDDLKLRLPSADPVDEQKEKHRDEAVLIWGTASSMGSVAVQLAAAAGYRVITTASAKNHDYVRALTPDDGGGRRHVAVFDYHRPGVAGDIIDDIKARGLTFAGAYDCVGLEESTRTCAEVVHAFGGGVLPSVLWPPRDLPSGVEARVVNAIRPGTVAGLCAEDVGDWGVADAARAGDCRDGAGEDRGGVEFA